MQFVRSLECFEGHHLPETAITALSTNVSALPLEMSHHNAVAFIRVVVLPIVMGLQQSASRPTVSGLCSINSLYPIPMVEGCVWPLLQHSVFTLFSANLLGKVLEESSTAEQLDSIWKSLSKVEVDSNGGQVVEMCV